MSKKTSIGGQALIEGIMMKGPKKTAMAVRKSDGEIDISYLSSGSPADKCKILGWPVIRGVANFIATLFTGYGALMKSADISGYTELEENGKKSKIPEWLMNTVMFIGMILGVALAVLLFFYGPSLIVKGIEYVFSVNLHDIVEIALEQVIKMGLFVGYVFAVSFMKDIRRVFMYHGAEHKAIFCYEKGLPMTVENIKAQKRFHPRCGTSFMILMILVSFFLSVAVEVLIPGVKDIMLVWVGVKILLVPLCCGVGYEILKICGRHDNLFTKIISAPGMWLQRLTTKEPDDSMMEIAAAALVEVVPDDESDRW